MKHRYLALSVLMASALTASAVARTAGGEPAPKLESATARASYSLGHQIGEDLKRQGLPLDRQAVLAGLKDGKAGRDPRIAEDEMQALLEGLKRRLLHEKVATRREQHEASVRAGSAFLEANASKPGVRTTPSGLQYKVLKEGSGARPGPTDRVRVHYRGTTIDGKEFDNTRKRQEPAEFALNAIIKGWSEGLQLMQEGAVYELYVPYTLAYNERGPLAHHTLIYNVELLKVNPEAAQPQTGAQ
jgi:FKBP-type peptidyl-prolyl cis-trans isomerase FklB